MNFLYDDIVHEIQNTIHSCINSATDRRSYVLERMFTKYSEITQYNGHYTVQGHSRSQILVPIESSYTTISYKKPEIMVRLYKTLVRPHLEYCVSVWSPHYTKDKKLLDLPG